MPYRVERIEPQNTALIVVDMQTDFLEFPSLVNRAAQVILPNLRPAIDFCRQNSTRAVYTTHVHRHDGSDLGLSEPIIPRTISEVAAIGPDYIVPGHCTGWKAANLLINTLPDVYVQSNTGTRLHSLHPMRTPRRRRLDRQVRTQI